MKKLSLIVTSILFVLLIIGSVKAEEVDLFEVAPLSASIGLGRVTFEGDEQVKNANFLSLRLGYDYTPRWTIEADMAIIPKLRHRTFRDPRRSDLTEDPWAIRLGGDVLYHLRNTENMRFDPFLTGGLGFIHYSEDLEDGATELMVICGGGLFYHFNDEWAIRSDARFFVTGKDTEANALFTIGVNWRWDAHVPVDYAVSGKTEGDQDSDKDGLIDPHEVQLGTDPFNPDTDGDELSDGEEVNKINTDPLNPDSDWDFLKDGAEVLNYRTNPLDPDTDQGGVRDGHEVIEDHTNPLNGADDLQLYTLNIEFDYNKAEIRPSDFEDLDVIVKVLQRDSDSTARIEGHADKRAKSSPKYNQQLSEKRAQAVEEYLIQVGGISYNRLESVGYGFERPIVPNDTEANMQRNRRTEVYIRSGEGGVVYEPEDKIIFDSPTPMQPQDAFDAIK